MRILYDSKNPQYKTPFGCLRQDEECTLRIRIPLSCNTTDVSIHFENDYTKETLVFPMQKIFSDCTYETYQAVFSLKETALYFYWFQITTAESVFRLFKFNYADTNIEDGEKWQLTCYAKDYTVPDSFCGKVMYQIFPDRFCKKGDTDITSKLTPYYLHESTEDIPDFLPNSDGKILNCDFFGGNLKGIESKLSAIAELGTAVIYLNPIFKAYSNHRYDTCDYKQIDPLLGTEEDFTSLCNAAHRKNIKIILDGVFSHTGSNSIYFDKNKIFSAGAYSNENSPYRNWYQFTDYPDRYASWWGIDTLPCVDELCEDYINYIISDEDSVIAHWLRLGADGFRLDVADELPDRFIRLLHEKVKEIKPNAIVIGEVWEDASNKISYGERRHYFSDNELDSVMNYVFKNAIIAYVREDITAKDFSHTVMTIMENYPQPVVHCLMNSLSTHDTTRILTGLSDADENMPKEEKAYFRLSETDRYTAVQKEYTAAFLQFMLPGTACIYYGDEIGMEGFNDPFNRGFYQWNAIDRQIREFYIQLGKIKNGFEALFKGNIRFLRNDDILIFERYTPQQAITVVVNHSHQDYNPKLKNPIISHNISIIGDTIYVQQYGFAAFVS